MAADEVAHLVVRCCDAADAVKKIRNWYFSDLSRKKEALSSASPAKKVFATGKTDKRTSRGK